MNRKQALELAERCYFQILRERARNATHMAQLAGVNRTWMYQRLKQLGVPPPRTTRNMRTARWKEMGL